MYCISNKNKKKHYLNDNLKKKKNFIVYILSVRLFIYTNQA